MKLSRLHLSNFKCLADVVFEFGNLNLLAGGNGCGKSSVIHSLLLLRQSFEQLGNVDYLLTYGKYINLGAAGDIFYEHAGKEEDISYNLTNEKGDEVKLFYQYVPESRMLSCRVPYEGDLSVFNIWGDAFEYLSADRIGPQTVYSSIGQGNCLGIHGENAFNFLEKHGASWKVENAFWDETQNEYLLYHVNRWLGKIFQGFNVKLSQISEADAVSLRYTEKARDMVSSPHRAVNVGFGITYVLPILVSLLKARKGDFIILENPEAHLHPRAQRIIGELLAQTAATGAQIVVETHSDHILNGIRISVKERNISPEEVKMFFFMKEDVGNKYNVNIYSPQMDGEGNIDIWPEGFFDEWDNALARLF